MAQAPAADCRVEQQPGPDDAPPAAAGGDAIDLTDQGAGRLRLCLAGPNPVSVEGTAWCTWTDDRTAVRAVAGHPVDVEGGGKLEGSFDLDRGEAFVGGTTASGEVGTWSSEAIQPAIEASDDGLTGAAGIHVEPWLDPENPPAVRPSDVDGTIAWACGPAPAPRGGRSTGQLTVRLDAPVSVTKVVRASCSWLVGDAGPYMDSLQVDQDLFRVGNNPVSISINPDNEHPDRAMVEVSSTTDTGGALYASNSQLISIAQARDASSGVLRLRHLAIQGNSDERLVPGADELSGVARWSCPPPAVPGETIAGSDPGDPPDEHPGRATVTLDPAVAGPVHGEVTCTYEQGNASYVRLVGLNGSFESIDRRFELRWESGEIVLAVVSLDGMPLGEYVGQVNRIGDDVLRGPLLIEVNDFAFEPTDSIYVPLGGPDAPRSVALSIVITCDVDPARLPGWTLGRLELSIGSGVDRTWTAEVACNWKLSGGKPIVAGVTSRGGLDFNGQQFRVETLPDLVLITTTHTTVYQVLPSSTLTGSITADGRSGEQTFTGLGLRGRQPSIYGRLGGKDGPEAIDGKVAWSCGEPPTTFPPG